MSCPFRSPRELRAFVSALEEYVSDVEKAVEEARERLKALRYLYVWGSPVGREAYEKLAAAVAAAAMLARRLPGSFPAPMPVTPKMQPLIISGPRALRIVAALLANGYSIRVGPYTVSSLEELLELLRHVRGGNLVVTLPESLAAKLLKTRLPQALKPRIEEIAEQIHPLKIEVYTVPDNIWPSVRQLSIGDFAKQLEEQGVKVGTISGTLPPGERRATTAPSPLPPPPGAAAIQPAGAPPFAAVPALGIPVAAGAPTGQARVIEAVRL